jgi:RNA polymerase sigma-70 factor (ECF subfamily)
VSRDEVHERIEAIYKIEMPRLVARLARMIRDVGTAEELAQDALVVALETWPETGVPDVPAAWLLATAKRRGIDRLRRGKMQVRKHEEIGRELESADDPAARLDAALDDDVGDDLLRLIFTTCHPALSADARVALTLRLLGGLTTDEIARAFLVPENTIAQRIVRGKRTLAEHRVEFEVPRSEERQERLASVLEVVYLVFNEGYTATAGAELARAELMEEALRLGRVLGGLAPQESEVFGLLALMEFQASRTRARTGRGGEPIVLLDQDRSRWDRGKIQRGLAALHRAQLLGGARAPYALQAAIAGCHSTAATAAATDWKSIAALYGLLAEAAPSPIVELNRAVALAMAEGPESGLAHLDAMTGLPALASYHHLFSVRGDLLARLGRRAEARAEFERAAKLTRNARERELLLARAAAMT